MIVQCSTCPRPALVVAELSDGDRPACGPCSARWTCNVRPVPQLGRLMWATVIYVRALPGVSRGAVARACAHLAERKVMYAAITRCVRAGLIVDLGDTRRGALELTSLGELTRVWARPAR